MPEKRVDSSIPCLEEIEFVKDVFNIKPFNKNFHGGWNDGWKNFISFQKLIEKVSIKQQRTTCWFVVVFTLLPSRIIALPFVPIGSFVYNDVSPLKFNGKIRRQSIVCCLKIKSTSFQIWLFINDRHNRHVFKALFCSLNQGRAYFLPCIGKFFQCVFSSTAAFLFCFSY